MLIKCWGSRGSIPVSGVSYVKYGGDTTCVEIRPENGRVIIIDAGTGIRNLGNALRKEGCRSVDIFFTHAHWDHIIGFPYFSPIYTANFNIRIHCRTYGLDMEKILEYQMMPPMFPVNLNQVKASIEYLHDGPGGFEIEGLQVQTIPLSHPNQGSGFKFTENGKSFTFITDNELGHVHQGGLAFDAYRDFCSGSDLLMHDAEFTEAEYERYRTWGHSSYTKALELAIAGKVKRFGLFHFNQERRDEQIDQMVGDCKKKIGQAGSGPECFGVNCGFKIQL